MSMVPAQRRLKWDDVVGWKWTSGQYGVHNEDLPQNNLKKKEEGIKDHLKFHSSVFRLFWEPYSYPYLHPHHIPVFGKFIDFGVEYFLEGSMNPCS